MNRTVFDLQPIRPIGRYIYAKQRARQTRSQSTATKFFRNLEQLAVLEGPLRPIASGARLRVLVSACSLGCEAYTIAGFLAEKFPNLDWQIDANDISEDALAVAKGGIYGREHGLGDELGPLCRMLERRVFNLEGGTWQVRRNIADRVKFERADVLDQEFLEYREYDLVFGQNFMIHMGAAESQRAFAALVGALRPGGALFVGGMDLETKPSLVAAHDLVPLDWNIAKIHDADEMRRSAWPWDYWSLEPVNKSAEDFVLRYATIFRKS